MTDATETAALINDRLQNDLDALSDAKFRIVLLAELVRNNLDMDDETQPVEWFPRSLEVSITESRSPDGDPPTLRGVVGILIEAADKFGDTHEIGHPFGWLVRTIAGSQPDAEEAAVIVDLAWRRTMWPFVSCREPDPVHSAPKLPAWLDELLSHPTRCPIELAPRVTS